MKTRPLSSVLARLIWLCMAPLLLLAGWLAWDHLRELEERHVREAGNLARNFATTIDRFLDARLRALNMLAISPLADDPRRWPELYREAQGFQESFGAHVIFADEQSRMLFNTRQPLGAALPRLPLSKGRSAAPLALATGRPQVGDIVFGPLARTTTVAIAVPARREGRPTRLMLSTLETSQLQQRIEQFALPAGWSIALLDGTGANIARRSPPGFDGARDVDADHRFIVKSDISAWATVLEIPRASHAALYREAILYLGATIVLALLLGLAGGALLSRRIGRQMAALATPADGPAPTFDIAEIAAARSRLDAAAAELDASHRRLQLWGEAFRRAEVGVVIGDARSNTFAAVNTAFARQRGYAEDELVGAPILSVFPAERRDELRARWPVLDAQGHAVFESEHQRKDGSCFPVLVDITVLRDADGTPLNRIGFVLDISGRKQAEQALAAAQVAELERQRQARIALLNQMQDANAARVNVESANAALRESQERLQLLIDHAPAALAMFDRDMRYLAASRRWLDDYDLGEGGILGRSHYEIFPEIPESWREVHRRGLAGEVVRNDEDRFQRADGSAHWLRWEVRPWRAADGGVGGIVIFTEDITGLVEANRGIRLGAERVRLLAEVVERIAAVRDLRGLMDVVRPAVRQLTGADGATLVLKDEGHCFYADEDAIGPLWKGQRFPLESCISGWAMLNAQPAVIEDIYADPRIPHPAYRPTFVKSLVMMPVGRVAPAAAIGAYWATQHRASDQELELHRALADAMSIGLANIDLIQNLERRVAERTAELTAANHELDSFAYAVSHDLRAPLRAMSGFTQALVEDHGDKLAGDARVWLDQIGIASRRMGELIDGLLALSRSTRGELRRDEVDLSAMARRLLDDLIRAEPDRPVAINVEAGLMARGDTRMLEAALANLLANAWKYTGHATAPSIRLYAENRAGLQWYCVADNGAGFDMAHAARLFQPFQRLHRQDEFPGIGIGLATVRRIVQRHGGRIEARGEPGQGATFCFTLSSFHDQEPRHD